MCIFYAHVSRLSLSQVVVKSGAGYVSDSSNHSPSVVPRAMASLASRLLPDPEDISIFLVPSRKSVSIFMHGYKARDPA
jgi:hypothetical protein